MKQRRIKELTINHYEQGSSVTYTPSRTEEYAPVLAQAEAHQDLRFHAEVNSVETLIILPWESVISVSATYETADVAAPHDDICDGYCAKKGLNIELKDISSKCYTLDGASLASMSFVVGGETITVTALDGDVSGLIKAKTYDCEAVDAEITYEMVLSEGTATLTITATYNGDTVTKTISAETECA